MTDDKGKPRGGRILYQSEIFKDGPATDKGNLSTTIGAEQGIEFFGGGTGSQRRPASRQDPPRARPRDPRLRRDRRAGRRRRPGRDGRRHRRRPPRRRRPAGRALQPPGRPLDRRPRHLDRPHDGLVGPAHHPRHRRRPDGAAAQGRDPGPPARRLGLQGRGHRRLLGAAHGRLPWHRHLVADRRSRGAQDRCPCRWWARPRCACCCTPGPPRRSSRAMSSRAPSSRARRAATPSSPRW